MDPAKDTNGGTAYNMVPLWFDPNTELTDELKALAQVYEQYCVHRMEVYATLGKGFDAGNKFKLELFSRVDTGSAPATPSLAAYFSVLSGQNTTLHTFNERGRVKIADVRPQFLGYGTPTAYQMMLPNTLQWFELNPAYFSQMLFRGVTIASAIPDETIAPASLSVQLTVAVTFKFRGRVISNKAYPTTMSMVKDLDLVRDNDEDDRKDTHLSNELSDVDRSKDGDSALASA